MVSQKQKMKGLQEFAKSLRRGEGGAAIAKLLYYSSNPTPVDVSKKNKTIKTKNPMKVKYSTFKQKSIINRQISNSRNFFKKEDN